MRLDPAIGTFTRRDEARAQARLNAAIDAWRCSDAAAPVLAGLGRWGRGEHFAASPALAGLLASGGAAQTLLGPLIAELGGALAAQPLSMVPLRHGGNGALTSVVLAREGTAALSLVVLDGARLPRSADCVSFAPGEEYEVVLTGKAHARLARMTAGGITLHDQQLTVGTAMRRDAACEALLFDRVDGTLLLLRAQRRPLHGAGRITHALDDARVLSREPAPGDARLETLVALLGRMKRADAAPAIAGLALDPVHSDQVRWQALREALALDTRAGFVALSAVACDAGDPLAAPAGALRATLIESWPQLLELAPCPA